MRVRRYKTGSKKGFVMKKIIALILAAAMAVGTGLTASARTYDSPEPRFSEAMLDFAEYCKTHTYKQQLAHYANEFAGDDAGEMNFFTEEDFLRIKKGENALVRIRYDLWDKYYYFVDEPHYILNFDFGLSSGIEASSLYHYLNERDVFTVKELLRDAGIEEEPENLVVVRIDSIDMYMSGYNYKGYDLISCKNGWNEIDGKRYFVKKDGTLATQSVTIGKIRYKFGKDGVCRGEYTGFTKSSKGRRYWKNGILQKNKTVAAKNGTVYRADKKGYLTEVGDEK